MSDSNVKRRNATHAEESQGGEQAAEGPKSNGGAPQDGQPETPESGLEALETRIEELASENRRLQDELLRKAADFENSRKRVVRDRDEAIRYANAALLSDVLPIIDDFERAIQSAEESKDFAAFYAGVSLIEKQLVSVLERNWGLKRFSAAGEPFDPEKHEAIAAEESEAHDKELVLEEYQKGYLLHDRVLRPAKVKVAKPVALPAPPEGSARSKEEQ